MPTPLVTIAIPNFNQGAFIADAIESAVRQTCSDVEILIIDNASTDDSWARIQAFEDRRIRALRNDRNVGLVPNWTACVRQARGKYLKVLQADDLLEPDAVERCATAMQATGVELCLTSYRRFTVGDVFLEDQSERLPVDGAIARETALEMSRDLSRFVPPSGTMYDTAAAQRAGGFGGAANICGDFLLWSRLVARGPIVAVREFTGRERVHPNQARRSLDALTVYRDMSLGIRHLLADSTSAASKTTLSAWAREVERAAALASIRLLWRGRVAAGSRIAIELARSRAAMRAYSSACQDVARIATRRLGAR